ncbi:MAG: CAP domain-containing protein [Gemmatimonadetes bacterium]|nr:CAP domain-containing protein [Gemmatimonadota bacterium]
MAHPAPDTARACPQTPGQIVLEEVNRIRTEAGLGRLSVDLRLVAAAMTQARDIAAGAPVGHVGLDGSLPDQRVREAGYEWSRVGENVAAGVPGAKEVVADWMSSEHHRENILGGGFTQIGVAFVDVRSSAYGTYWVQVFATPLDSAAQGQPARCNP